MCVCVYNQRGDHLWENVWHSASGGQQRGWRARESRETEFVSVRVCIRQNLIRGKTNRGKDWVKEQEELRVHREKKKDAEEEMIKKERWKEKKQYSGREEDKK